VESSRGVTFGDRRGFLGIPVIGEGKHGYWPMGGEFNGTNIMVLESLENSGFVRRNSTSALERE